MALYLFIDESGDFGFNPRGSKFFILTAFVTTDPTLGREKLIQLRYRLLEDGIDQEFFHASEDKQAVRDQVYSFLAGISGAYEVHSIIAQKNKVNPSLYREIYEKKGKLISRDTGLGLYKKLCECLLKYVFKGKSRAANKIVIVLGSIFVGEKKKVLLQTLKHFLKNNFPGIPFEIYSHQSAADLNCQLADYCCWAVKVKADRNETRPFNVIGPQVKSVFDIFGSGKTEYYPYDSDQK